MRKILSTLAFAGLALFTGAFAISVPKCLAQPKERSISLEMVNLGGAYGVITAYENRVELEVDDSGMFGRILSPDSRALVIDDLFVRSSVIGDGIIKGARLVRVGEIEHIDLSFSKPVFVLGRKAESAVRYVIVAREISELSAGLDSPVAKSTQSSDEKVVELRALIREMSEEIVHLREMLKKNQAE